MKNKKCFHKYEKYVGIREDVKLCVKCGAVKSKKTYPVGTTFFINCPPYHPEHGVMIEEV